MAILLGIADHGGSRRDVLRAIAQAIGGRALFAESKEDLTPFDADLPSFIPFAVVTGQVLLRPRSAHRIATSAINSYSLSAAAVETIMAFDGSL